MLPHSLIGSVYNVGKELINQAIIYNRNRV